MAPDARRGLRVRPPVPRVRRRDRGHIRAALDQRHALPRRGAQRRGRRARPERLRPPRPRHRLRAPRRPRATATHHGSPAPIGGPTTRSARTPRPGAPWEVYGHPTTGASPPRCSTSWLDFPSRKAYSDFPTRKVDLPWNPMSPPTRRARRLTRSSAAAGRSSIRSICRTGTGSAWPLAGSRSAFITDLKHPWLTTAGDAPVRRRALRRRPARGGRAPPLASGERRAVSSPAGRRHGSSSAASSRCALLTIGGVAGASAPTAPTTR